MTTFVLVTLAVLAGLGAIVLVMDRFGGTVETYSLDLRHRDPEDTESPRDGAAS